MSSVSGEKRKRCGRKTKMPGKPLYDENGIHIDSKLDLCDCLDVKCAGCYFPCPKCTSEKCGNVCRRNRDFMYYTEIEASDDRYHKDDKKNTK